MQNSLIPSPSRGEGQGGGENRNSTPQLPSSYLIIPCLLALFILLPACAGLEVIPSGNASAEPSAPYAVPDNLQSQPTLHFLVKGTNYNTITQVGNLCEEIYNKIMFDTNLFSFKPKQNYLIAVYRTKSDYHHATGYPIWSGGGTVTQPLGQILPSERDNRARTAIYTWEENLSPTLLAHEISHLILNEFMEYQTYSDMKNTYWINEGFATYEETSYYDLHDQETIYKTAAPHIYYGLPLRNDGLHRATTPADFSDATISTAPNIISAR